MAQMDYPTSCVYRSKKGEIATLTKSQVRYDDDSNRHYLLITDGKTENAAREVPLHNHLIDLGFLDFAASKKTELFSEIAGTNMAKIGKVMSDIWEELNIPYRDIHNQRRIVHSFRHSVVTAATGWMNDITHLQQVVGHEKTGDRHNAQVYPHLPPVRRMSYH